MGREVRGREGEGVTEKERGKEGEREGGIEGDYLKLGPGFQWGITEGARSSSPLGKSHGKLQK